MQTDEIKQLAFVSFSSMFTAHDTVIRFFIEYEHTAVNCGHRTMCFN